MICYHEGFTSRVCHINDVLSVMECVYSQHDPTPPNTTYHTISIYYCITWRTTRARGRPYCIVVNIIISYFPVETYHTGTWASILYPTRTWNFRIAAISCR